MRVLSYVVPAEDDGRLIRRVARGRLGISSHQLARAKALGALCLDGESVHADHAVRAYQIRRFALFHLLILHSDQLAHLPLRLPDQNFIIKQHKRRVNSHADCDIHNLKHHSGP